MARTFTAESPLDDQGVERALLLARQVRQAAEAAADGKVLSAVEGAAALAPGSWSARPSKPPSYSRPTRPKKGAPGRGGCARPWG